MTTTTQTATVESVQMLDVGVVLEVTPRVTRDGRVLMRIKPKVSTGDDQRRHRAAVGKDERSRNRRPDVQRPGHGASAGSSRRKTATFKASCPLLGDIPYLGILFQKRQVVKSRKEIVVTLRPYVLPYSPILAERIRTHKMMRTEEPLTQGAICALPAAVRAAHARHVRPLHVKHPVVPMGPSDCRWSPFGSRSTPIRR